VVFLAYVHLTLTFLALSLSLQATPLFLHGVTIISALGLQYVAEYKRFTVTVTDFMYGQDLATQNSVYSS